VLKFQSHFAEKCNFTFSPSSLLLLKIFSSKKKVRKLRHNNNDFASQNNLYKKRHEKLQSLFFVVHVQGKGVKEEENLCQITAAVRMKCKMYTYIRPMHRICIM